MNKVIDFIPENYVYKGQVSINGTVYHNIPYEVTDFIELLAKRLYNAIEHLEGCGINDEMLECCDYWDVNGITLLKILRGEISE